MVMVRLGLSKGYIGQWQNPQATPKPNPHPQPYPTPSPTPPTPNPTHPQPHPPPAPALENSDLLYNWKTC